MYNYRNIDEFLLKQAEDISSSIADFYLLEAIKNIGKNIDTNTEQYVSNTLTNLANKFKQRLLLEIGKSIYIEFIVINYALGMNSNSLVSTKDSSNSFFKEIQEFYSILGYPTYNKFGEPIPEHHEASVREWALNEMDIPQTVEEFEMYMPLMEQQFNNLGSIGKVWVKIITAWIQLFNSTDVNSTIIALDHLVDMQHVSGNIFSRTSLEIDDNLLNMKSNQNSLWELYDYASPQIKKVTAPIIKQIEGKGYDMYQEQPKKYYPPKFQSISERYPDE